MKKRLGSSRNQCAGCNVYFNSVTAFDKHRTGQHGVNRRCRTEEEMRSIGMSINKAGFWIGEEYDSNRRNKTKDGDPDTAGDGS
jgi:hypothetical protein